MTLDYLQSMVHPGHHGGQIHRTAPSANPTVNIDHRHNQHQHHHQQHHHHHHDHSNGHLDRLPEVRPELGDQREGLNTESHPKTWTKWQQYMFWRMHGHRNGLPRPSALPAHVYHSMPGHYRRHFIQNEKEKKEIDDLDLFPGQSAFLGPQLWDKTLPYDGKDFELEYMDLDEFLQENGISDELPNVMPQSDQTTLSQGSPTATLPARSPQPSPQSHGDSHSSAASPISHLQDISNSAPAKVVLPPSVRSPCHSQDSSDSFGNAKVANSVPQTTGVHTSGMVMTSAPRKVDVKTEIEFQPQDLALATIPASSMDTRSPLPGLLTNSQEKPDAIPRDDNNIPLPEYCQEPGQEDFDPRKRSFTDEELRPQPMIKKSRKIFVPDDLKDDKYWARRRKNNVAAKRSRDARRVKENQISMRAAFLEKEFDQMRDEVQLLRAENKELRNKLGKYEAAYATDS